MAHAIPFNTLKYTETLIAAGVPEKQAKAHATALLESYETAELATKFDLDKLEISLKSELSSMKSELSSMKWVLGMVAAGIVALLIKTFF